MSKDPAVFQGTVDAEGRVHLDFPAQQQAYCKARLAEKHVDVIIAEHGALKTRLQEKGFHAMLHRWAEEGHRIDDLKQIVLAHIFGTMEVPHPVTGEVCLVLRQPHSSKLNRVDYSKLIEGTAELAAEAGVWLELPHEYRMRKEAERRAGAA